MTLSEQHAPFPQSSGNGLGVHGPANLMHGHVNLISFLGNTATCSMHGSGTPGWGPTIAAKTHGIYMKKVYVALSEMCCLNLEKVAFGNSKNPLV